MLQDVVIQSMFQIFALEHSKEWQTYPEFDETTLYRDSYGVCDSLENLKKVYPELEASERVFVVNLCCITKDDQPSDGGWRWHKWGSYIGDQEPTCEYIYDEPLIDEVYCYHIYEKIKL